MIQNKYKKTMTRKLSFIPEVTHILQLMCSVNTEEIEKLHTTVFCTFNSHKNVQEGTGTCC